MALLLLMFLFLFSFPLFLPSLQSAQSQSQFLSLVKHSLSISRWDSDAFNCNLSGIACDVDGRVIEIDLSSYSLTGYFPPGLCSALPNIRALRLAHNYLHGNFPHSLLNCSFLHTLNLSYTGLSGPIPDLSPLRSLRLLDLSNNFFSGAFPLSILNLTNVETLNFNENPGFEVWQPPEELTKLTNLKVLILSTSSMRGHIPDWIGNMTTLTDLELAGNFLVGPIPASIGKLQNLQLLELYYNQLSGSIPEELGNLTNLSDIDLSVNQLIGPIPAGLCALPRLSVLQLYSNGLTGAIPPVLGNSTSLSILSIYRNFFTGSVPPALGELSELVVLELSENQLSGELPKHACAGGKLLYFLVLDNLFSGELPASYATCISLLRFRANNNQLSGTVPGDLFGLPHASIIDLGFNRLSGTITKSIGNAKNLTALFVPNNQISGELPPEISSAFSLVKIDLSNNQISGPVPAGIGQLSKLNQLTLQCNKLDSSIPESLSSLRSLNVLNLSNNLLTGEIPKTLCNLLPNSLDFSNNHLSGPIPLPLVKEGLIESVSGNPGLCLPIHLNNLTDPLLPQCQKPMLRRSFSSIWIITAVSILIAIVGALCLAKRWFNPVSHTMEQDKRMLSNSSSSSYDMTSFHKITIDQHEIVEALIDKNIVGRGGSGTVYKIELTTGDQVAVKKIWSKYLDKELRSEVETLGSVRHKNIVKLYCSFSSMDSNLLVYEYMPNGNLWDALHQAGSFLDWPQRHRIAMGIAQGLAYLHHDLLFPIVHRDIKSSNVLLDGDFEPKVADFGIAKVLQARGENQSPVATTTVIAGTCGYLAPEYAYSTKATTKCDVYSFGVVLMELVTGKKPNEPEFGENKDIIHWVSSKMAAKETAMELPDKRLSWSPYKEEMIQALRVAMRCTSSTPGLRPSMNEVVQLLIEAGPCGCRANGSFKMRHSAPMKPKT